VRTELPGATRARLYGELNAQQPDMVSRRKNAKINSPENIGGYLQLSIRSFRLDGEPRVNAVVHTWHLHEYGFMKACYSVTKADLSRSSHHLYYLVKAAPETGKARQETCSTEHWGASTSARAESWPTPTAGSAFLHP